MSYYADWAQPSDLLPAGALIALCVVFVALMIWGAWVDWKTLLLPVPVLIGSLVLGLISLPLWSNWQTHLLAGGLCGLLFFILANIKLRGNYAMGMGDAYLYAACGLLLGKGVMICVLTASLVGMLVSLWIIRRHGYTRDHRVAHAPFIVLGLILTLGLGLLY